MTAKTIVLADDDVGLLETLALRCRQLGLEVATADSTFGALRLIDELSPDVICLDVDMPCGNGLTICESLARTAAAGPPTMIVLTGRTDERVVRRCHQLGAYYVLKGPDSWARISPLICELLLIGTDVSAAAGSSVAQYLCPSHPPTRNS